MSSSLFIGGDEMNDAPKKLLLVAQRLDLSLVRTENSGTVATVQAVSSESTCPIM